MIFDRHELGCGSKGFAGGLTSIIAKGFSSTREMAFRGTKSRFISYIKHHNLSWTLLSVSGVPESGRAMTPSFIKTRTASRMATMQARGANTMSLDEEMLPSWSTMSGNLPDQITVSQRLSTVYDCHASIVYFTEKL